jgi:glutamate/tyrosine decarboxylase-like PLP-dependent enzyme
MRDVVMEAGRRAVRYLDGVNGRPVVPSSQAIASLKALDIPLPDGPTDPLAVLAELDEIGSPATVATTGGRYFGFVTGGSLPAAVGASVLAAAWDQNAVLEVCSPIAAALEEVCRRWLLSALGLPSTAGVGFVTGATMANFAALAAARHAVLGAAGWDVEAAGLFGAPPVSVIVGEEVHVSVLKALGLLGFGRERVTRVPVDGQGRMRADAVPPIAGPAIVCLQAGNVNTGAIDPVGAIGGPAKARGAWVHVDGAFGLWAAAAPVRRHLTADIETADSWATDAHKWLNVPYDSGLVFVREAGHLRAAMSASAAYLLEGDRREPSHFVPEMSRRARGVEIWAALRSLGRRGLADLVERSCRHAGHFAERLKAAGYRVLNQVDLNQVLVSFGDDEATRRVIRRVQEDGTCWCGGTVWQGRAAMRISVSCWATAEEDVRRSLEAILRIAAAERGG